MTMITVSKQTSFLPPSPTPPTPWLVIPNGQKMTKMAFFNVPCPQKSFIRRVPPEIRGMVCVASMHGWVLMLCLSSVRCCLWNPATQQLVHLPALDREDLRGLWIIVSPPNNPDCMVLFVGAYFFLIWELGDENWTAQDYRLGGNLHFFLQIISCTDGRIYGMTSHGRIAVFERPSHRILTLRMFNLRMFNNITPRSETMIGHVRLVESFGQVFFVRTHIQGYCNALAISNIGVFKLDFSREVYVKVEDIGDQIFFISGNGCKSFSATELGLKRNCIYIPFQKDLYKFDMENSTLSVYFPFTNLPHKSFSPFWFIMPSNGPNGFDEDKGKNYTTTQELKIVCSEGYSGSLLHDLPKDILCSIAICLGLAVEYNKFRYVSKSIRLAVPPLQLPTKYPLLMFSSRGKSGCGFFDPVKCFTFCFDMPELVGARIRYSKDGWLLLSRDDHFFFFNPFTKATIELPEFPRVSPDRKPNYVFNALCFSSAPTSPDCIVCGICFRIPKVVWIFSVRPGQNEWTFTEGTHEVFFFPSYNSPVFHGSLFCFLGVKRDLGVFDIRDNTWSILSVPRPCSSIRQNFLVECNGELKSVFVGHGGKYVLAYRFDQQYMNWHSLSTLNEELLFVSRTTSVSAKVISASMRNKIYFPISFKGNFLSYSLETCRWHFSYADHSKDDLNNTSERLHCTWIQPSFE